MGVVRVTAITSQLVQKGVKVIKTFQEKDRESGLASNVWNVLFEVCHTVIVSALTTRRCAVK